MPDETDIAAACTTTITASVINVTTASLLVIFLVFAGSCATSCIAACVCATSCAVACATSCGYAGACAKKPSMMTGAAACVHSCCFPLPPRVRIPALQGPVSAT
eukprot:6455598-Amphidinium_carterae.1